MKKIISFILIMSILITLIMPFNKVSAEGENVIFSLSSEVTELVEGDIIEVNLNIELLNSEQVNGLDIILNYDSEILEFDETEGFYTSRETRWSEPESGYAEGEIHIVSTRDSGYADRQGLVYTMYFKVLESAESTDIYFSSVMCSYITHMVDATGIDAIIPSAVKTYTIAYEENTTDTVIDMPSDGTKEKDVDYTIVAGPTRVGYSFAEWNTEIDGTGTSYKAGDIYNINEDLTLYAQWKVQSTLTVKPNGGVWEGSSATQSFIQDEGTTKTINDPITTPNGNIVRFNPNGGTVDTLQTTQTTTFSGWTGATLDGIIYTYGITNETLVANYEGNSILLPTASKAGEKFIGWEDSEGNLVGSAGDMYAPIYTTPNAIITLIAKYQEETYTLTINPNGGIYTGETTIEGTYNSTTTLNEPIRTGYTVTLDNNDGTLPTSVTQTYTFEGWTSSAGTINGTIYTFEENDATVTANYTANSVMLTEPTKIGYKFEGWYTDNINGTKVESSYMPTSDITLYAQWIPEKYIITFDAGEDAITNVTDKEVIYGEQYGELPVPTKEGYIFKGWKAQDGTLISQEDIVNITSDITVYAEYEIKTYIVTFKNDDGTEIKAIKVEHGSIATFTGENPVKEGVAEGYEATFTGWENAEDLENVTQDVTVTATYKVTPIVYTITYYNTKDADNSSNPTKYTVEDDDIVLSNLSNQQKYIFKGWYTSNEEDAEKITSIDISRLENIILYAQWENDELYLESEKYKVGKNDIDKYENGDIYLDKIEPNTTVAELISNCDTNGTITVIDKNGNVLEENDLVGTKMTIKVTRYDEEITLTAIVMGDLDEDGKVTATDLSALNQTILYKKTLEEAIFKAADLDDNEKIAATDLSTINNTILGTVNLKYDKNQSITTGI